MIIPDRTSLVDIHSHLVPGVDDGARNVQAAVESVERMTHEGIRRLITTPHIRGSLTLDPPRLEARLSEVSRAFHEAASALKEAFPEVEYRRGHEVLLDVPEVDLSDERIRMAGSSFVLVEWPRLQIPPGTPRVLGLMRQQGYRPIVAHPERYMGQADPVGLATRWRAAGAYLQVNYGSLDGRYGTEANEIALQLLEAGVVDYLASDFHGKAGLKIYKEAAWEVLESRDASETLDLLCRVNPGRILEDLEPVPVPALPPPSKFFDRLKGIMRQHTRPERQRG
ncbi:MAG: CpsB/CapC family capsule biosynthesis tyrosine phosphatase [Longimicrobiales bacterium]|nr:CpsB/CapC family capsule biosynthesis tyrosine phosphatase [Longimicrobiales bacterium]